jgi:hypothetical protein
MAANRPSPHARVELSTATLSSSLHAELAAIAACIRFPPQPSPTVGRPVAAVRTGPDPLGGMSPAAWTCLLACLGAHDSAVLAAASRALHSRLRLSFPSSTLRDMKANRAQTAACAAAVARLQIAVRGATSADATAAIRALSIAANARTAAAPLDVMTSDREGSITAAVSSGITAWNRAVASMSAPSSPLLRPFAAVLPSPFRGEEAPPRAPGASALPSLRMRSRTASLDDGPMGPLPVAPPSTSSLFRLPSFRRTTTSRPSGSSDAPDTAALLPPWPPASDVPRPASACTPTELALLDHHQVDHGLPDTTGAGVEGCRPGTIVLSTATAGALAAHIFALETDLTLTKALAARQAAALATSATAKALLSSQLRIAACDRDVACGQVAALTEVVGYLNRRSAGAEGGAACTIAVEELQARIVVLEADAESARVRWEWQRKVLGQRLLELGGRAGPSCSGRAV